MISATANRRGAETPATASTPQPPPAASGAATAEQAASSDMAAAPDNTLELAAQVPEDNEVVPAEPLPACTYENRPARLVGYDQWQLTVLDTVFALPESYEPPDLVAAAGAFPEGSSGGGDYRVRAVMIPDLTALLAAAADAGIELALQSAYRSYAYQAQTHQYWVDLNGREAALATSARPGHSEHQLGTALDFRSLRGPPAWDLDDWALTPEGAWMRDNAWRFGFAMSYPEGSKELTCYSYEPWHYRYLGRELTAELHRLGVTPRELLWAKAAEVGHSGGAGAPAPQTSGTAEGAP